MTKTVRVLAALIMLSPHATAASEPHRMLVHHETAAHMNASVFVPASLLKPAYIRKAATAIMRDSPNRKLIQLFFVPRGETTPALFLGRPATRYHDWLRHPLRHDGWPHLARVIKIAECVLVDYQRAGRYIHEESAGCSKYLGKVYGDALTVVHLHFAPAVPRKTRDISRLDLFVTVADPDPVRLAALHNALATSLEIPKLYLLARRDQWFIGASSFPFRPLFTKPGASGHGVYLDSPTHVCGTRGTCWKEDPQ